jgi:cellulose synthase/poly-beta-1,6-N-acetylglucosamine synthase-like glycosyltransferase
VAAFSVIPIQSVALFIFWLSGALLVYTFAGYGALMTLLGRLKKSKNTPPTTSALPEVCVVLVVHNEEARIVARINNLLDADYPPEKIRVLVVSDASTDATVARIATLDLPRVTVVVHPARSGKAAGINTALTQCTSEIVVFADARQTFSPDAILRLAAHFADPKIGAVSGELEIATSSSAIGAGIDTYWRYERSLRASESRFDSCIGCTGAIYAIRRSLFTSIPPDTLLDDVVIPLQIATRHARVIHDPQARAFDPQPLEPEAERRRKQRTLAGNFQMLFRHPGWLLPWKNRLWWQLISHKYLRLCAPLFVLTAAGANLILAAQRFYGCCLVLFALFLISAALGSLPKAQRFRVFFLPAGFVFLRGFIYYLTHRNEQGWQ